MRVWEVEAVDLAAWGQDDSSVAPRRLDRELFTTKLAAKEQLHRWSNLTRNDPTHINETSMHWHCGKVGYSLTEIEVRRGEIVPPSSGDANDSIKTRELLAGSGEGSVHPSDNSVVAVVDVPPNDPAGDSN